VETQHDVLTAQEAVQRLDEDAAVLEHALDERPADRITAPYTVQAGPLGDFCESLHDLVAHVLMWDEISLAVFTEERMGRAHWSLLDEWEHPAQGAALNRAGVLAGRELPSGLLVERFRHVHLALVEEVGETAVGWDEPSHVRPDLPTRGALARHVMTIPGQPAFWHAALHLRSLPSHEATLEGAPTEERSKWS
jgi:hypothetical protein